METRKLQVSGHSTYVLSLPKSWVQFNGIQRGDTVRMHLQSDGTILVIPPGNRRGVLEHILYVPTASDSFFRDLVGLYLAGYHVVRLQLRPTVSASDRTSIKEKIRRLRGLEVTEETKDTMIIQDLFDPSLFSLPKALRRMQLLARAMLSDAIKAFLEGDTALAAEVQARDNDVEWLNWRIKKTYNQLHQDISFTQRMGVTATVGLNHLIMAGALERIADHATKMASITGTTRSCPKVIAETLSRMDKALGDLIDRAVSAFYSNNFDDANGVLESAVKVQHDIRGTIEDVIKSKKENTHDLVAHAYLFDSLGRICSYSMDMAETAINNESED